MEQTRRLPDENGKFAQYRTIAAMNFDEAWQNSRDAFEEDRSLATLLGAVAYLMYKVGPSALLETYRGPDGCSRSCAIYALIKYREAKGSIPEKIRYADQKVGMKCSVRQLPLSDIKLEQAIDNIDPDSNIVASASVIRACLHRKIDHCEGR